ncbi:hypothetical protein PG984_013068 [Apiospora sp. TS-2023a]
MSLTDSMMATLCPNLEGRMKLEHGLRIHFLELTSGLPAGSLPAGSQNNKSRSDLDRIFAQGGLFNEVEAPVAHSSGKTTMGIIRPYLISEKLCPPACEAALESLRPIFLNQLVHDKVERGYMLVVRTFTRPDSDRHLCAAVEDTQGGVDCIILQCRDHSLKAEETLPKGIVFAIKEPYYVAFPDLQHGIQVDHPSDLIELDISNDLYPAQWKDEVLAQYQAGASQLKAAGNRAVGKKEFMRATRLYNMAASLCTPTEEVLRRDVLRNRALTNLSLGRLPQALADAMASIDSSTEDLDERQALLQYKAQCRAGSALYGLGRYEEAARQFATASKLPLAQSTEAADGGLRRAMKRIKEEKTGEYDFQTIFNLVQPSRPLTDTASFLRNTKVVDFGPPRGRGLVATRDIAMGELVMCEKAFVASVQEGGSAAFVDAFWPNIHGKTSMGSMARLPMMLMQKMIRADSADEPVFRLYSEPRKLLSGRLIDGKPVVDSLTAHSVVQYNSFVSEDLCSSEMQCGFLGQLSPYSLQRLMDKMPQGGLIRQCGIWPHASMINHACDANSIHSFMGDLMIIRAAKDIKKGEELTIIYNYQAGTDPRKLQETLKLNYAFRCQCAACRPDLLLKWALLCLRDSGLKLSIDEDQEKLTWDATAAVRVDHSVEAALYACIAYNRLGKRTLAKQFRELAQLYWVIYAGSSVGFKERFPYDEIWKY